MANFQLVMYDQDKYPTASVASAATAACPVNPDWFSTEVEILHKVFARLSRSDNIVLAALPINHNLHLTQYHAKHWNYPQFKLSAPSKELATIKAVAYYEATIRNTQIYPEDILIYPVQEVE